MNCTNCELILHEIRPSESFFIPDDYRESSISSLIVYRANPGFFGDDRVGVVAEDLLGGYSLAYIFPILVRFDPCLNNATCKVSTVTVHTSVIHLLRGLRSFISAFGPSVEGKLPLIFEI